MLVSTVLEPCLARSLVEPVLGVRQALVGAGVSEVVLEPCAQSFASTAVLQFRRNGGVDGAYVQGLLAAAADEGGHCRMLRLQKGERHPKVAPTIRNSAIITRGENEVS